MRQDRVVTRPQLSARNGCLPKLQFRLEAPDQASQISFNARSRRGSRRPSSSLTQYAGTVAVEVSEIRFLLDSDRSGASDFLRQGPEIVSSCKYSWRGHS
jgi:hypothetical protein